MSAKNGQCDATGGGLMPGGIKGVTMMLLVRCADIGTTQLAQ